MKMRVLIGLASASVGIGLGYYLGGMSERHSSGVAPRASNRSAPVSGLGRSDSLGELDTVWRGRKASEHLLLATTMRDVRDPARIRELLENTHRMPGNVCQGTARGILLRNWVAVDPEAAARWCSKNAERHLSSLFETWAATDLSSARAAVSTVKASSARQLAGAVLEALAHQDTDEALLFLEEIAPRVSNNQYSIRKGIRQIAESDPQAVLEIAERMGAELRDDLREGAAKAMAQSDPVGAVDWWEKQADKKSLAVAVFGEIDPEFWSDALDRMARAGNAGLDSSLSYRWGRRAPERLLSLLVAKVADSEHLPEFQSAMSSSFQNWLYRDREAAIAWSEQLSAVDSERWTADAIAKSLSRAQPREVATPTTASTLVHASASRHDSYAVARLSQEERQRIPDELAKLPAEETLAVLDRILGFTDTLAVRDLPRLFSAVTVTEKNKSRLVGQLRNAMSFADDSPAEAARWSEQFPAGILRQTAAAYAAKTWHQYDQEAARAWADSLSDGATRAAALAALGDE